MSRVPSVDRIESFCGVDRPTAIKVRRLLDGRDDPHSVDGMRQWANTYYNSAQRENESIMAAVDLVLGTCGVEAIRAVDEWDRYFGDAVAVYCNTGDSYGGTVLYDVDRDAFYVTSWGDWVETSERNRRYTFS